MRIALTYLEQAWLDKDTNFGRCEESARAARSLSCQLIVFPEMTLTGYSMDAARIAEPEDESPSLARFGALAREVGLSIVFGACLRTRVGRPRNQLCVALPNGTSVAVYAKVHPFSFAGENDVFDAGDELALLNVGDMRIGASICYDLRFPELYAALAPACDAAVVIASWPARRVAHWRSLLVARAIENQFYMFGVNRIGLDGSGIDHEPSTMAVSPTGEVLAPTASAPGVDVFDVEPAAVARYREVFPTVRDKRNDLYVRLFERPVTT